MCSTLNLEHVGRKTSEKGEEMREKGRIELLAGTGDGRRKSQSGRRRKEGDDARGGAFARGLPGAWGACVMS